MRQYLVCILSLLVLSLARPDDYGRHKDRDKGKSCLTYQEANDLVQLLFSFTQPGFDPAVLEGRLTEDFIVQSGGFNFLSGQNVSYDNTLIAYPACVIELLRAKISSKGRRLDIPDATDNQYSQLP